MQHAGYYPGPGKAKICWPASISAEINGVRATLCLGLRARFSCMISAHGEVTERSKVHDWKSCVGPKSLPRVRIPPSPPSEAMPLKGGFEPSMRVVTAVHSGNPLSVGHRVAGRRVLLPAKPSNPCLSAIPCSSGEWAPVVFQKAAISPAAMP